MGDIDDIARDEPDEPEMYGEQQDDGRDMSAEGPLGIPPDCPGCGYPMLWRKDLQLYQCHSFGPSFVDADGLEVPFYDVPRIDCNLCTVEHGVNHAPGCPNGPEQRILCGVCREAIPISQVADHMNNLHDADLDRDQIEQTFSEAQHQLREMIANGIRLDHVNTDDGPGRASENIPIDIMDIWAACGHYSITGKWPTGFQIGGALFVAMDMFEEAAERSNLHLHELLALKQALLQRGHIASIEDPVDLGEILDGNHTPQQPGETP